MIGGVLSLDSRPHRWVDALRAFNIGKVGIYSPTAPNAGFLSNLVSKVQLERVVDGKKEMSDEPHWKGEECLYSYLGFGFEPNGSLFRRLSDKDFRLDDYYKRNLIYYVSQRFEENLDKFKFGMPIALVEGVLDCECFVAVTGYPFCIAYMTSYIRELLSIFLSTLTNKFLISPDNDGEDKKKLNADQLQKSLKNFKACNGVEVKILNTKAKDFGDIYRLNSGEDVTNARVLLKSFGGNK